MLRHAKCCMNIFVLDQNIKKCAQYHCDQHVSKMILESVQMLCTSLNKQGFKTPYKSTHIKHPKVLAEIEKHTFTDNGLTEFAQAMPNEFKFKNNAVRAYRSFYRGEKSKFAKWTKRPIPKWMKV